MIILHQGGTAAARIAQIVGNAADAADRAGAVFEGDPARTLPDYIDDIAAWLASAKRPRFIVINPARAGTTAERQALRSLRRMAVSKGVDIHLVGGDDVAPIADRIVADDSEMAAADRSAGAAAEAARLLHGEVMQPFRPAPKDDMPGWREIMAASGCTEDEARAKVAWMAAQDIWVNNLYQVNVEYGEDRRTAHLIIRRLDRQPIHNWPHFQYIKNALLGPECEAVEIYPPESQLVDEKHHYHLWGFCTPGETLGIGFRDGRKVQTDDD
jgi:hypothetical protein